MFTKAVLIASSVALASAASPAAVPNAQMKGEHAARQETNNKKATVASSSVASSAVITSGAMVSEWRDSCATVDAQPSADGYPLGACQGNWLTPNYSTKYTGCEMSADKTMLTVFKTVYATTGDCSGSGTSDNDVYTNLVDGCEYGFTYLCGADLSYSDYGSPQHYAEYNGGTCSGGEVYWSVYSYDSCTDDSGCIYWSASQSGKGICDDPDDTCFHVDTKIDYKGVEYTYEELKAGKEPECTVPHSPSSKGVVITTSCDKTVRVTDTHLMATTKGFQLAYSLKAGDVLYGDYGSNMCTVKSVEKEKTTQQYFGLNCVHSEVLASGLRASTFGDFHTLPSWYMTYVGGMIGTDAASSLGEYIAEWYFQK